MPYRAYIFDLDGTLYRGQEPIPGAVDAVARLKAAGAIVLYLTNNSGLTNDACATKLAHMGFSAQPREVYGTGRGAAIHCRDSGHKTAFIVGERGLAQSFAREGITVVNLDEDGVPAAIPANADVVVCGICRHFSFQFLDTALQGIRGGADFVATNRDATYPLEGDRIMPGSGSLVAALATCAEREPITVGKPNPYLLELAMREWALKPADCLVIGDRMDTDIECGVRAGCATLLVLTGVVAVGPAGQLAIPSVADLTLR